MSNPSPLILEVNSLCKHYPLHKGLLKKEAGSLRAVDHLSFTMREGEILGVVGESGSGKSTLALLLLRLIEPTCGSIQFFGKDLLKMNREELLSFRKEAQIIFQNPYASLNPRKTILEIIGDALLFHKIVKNENEMKEGVFSLLKQVGLEESAAFRYPFAFSGGQRQRIAIARAIALNPKFLICDEVISALDLSIQSQILSLLYDLKRSRKLSLLFISHDLTTIRRFSDRVIVMYQGKMVETGPVQSIFDEPAHPYTQLLLSCVPRTDPREKKKSCEILAKNERGISKEGCPFFDRCPVSKAECKNTLPPEKQKGEEHRYLCIH